MSRRATAGDLQTLALLVRVQEVEAALYREALQRRVGLSARERRLVERLRADEVEHVDALRATVKAGGGRAGHRAAPAFGAALASRGAFLKLANSVEDVAVSALNSVVPMLASADLRTAVISIAGVEARHAALVRVARGRTPAPAAFDRVSSTQAVRARLREFERGGGAGATGR